MDDKSLINLFLERSEQAISELETMYGAGAKALAFNVLGDARDAEECLSDGLLAVWNTVPPTRPTSMKAYLLGITRNRAVERYHALSAQKRNSHYDRANLFANEVCGLSNGDWETHLFNSIIDINSVVEVQIDEAVFALK